jgi:hypothetical protein
MKQSIAAPAALATLLPAAARDNGQWADSPVSTDQWSQSLMHPDNPSVSCCGEVDAFEACVAPIGVVRWSPLPACGERSTREARRVRGPLRESEPVETPPHRAEFWFSRVPRGPLPASGARGVALFGNRSKRQRQHASDAT